MTRRTPRRDARDLGPAGGRTPAPTGQVFAAETFVAKEEEVKQFRSNRAWLRKRTCNAQTPEDQEGLKIAERLGLTPQDTFNVKGNGSYFKAVPENAVQLAWAKAEEPIRKANQTFVKAQTEAQD